MLPHLPFSVAVALLDESHSISIEYSFYLSSHPKNLLCQNFNCPWIASVLGDVLDVENEAKDARHQDRKRQTLFFLYKKLEQWL